MPLLATLPVLALLVAVSAEPLEDVRVLAGDDMAGRAAGTPGSERARAYIMSRFEEIGLTPVGASFEYPFGYMSRSNEPRTGTNIVACLCESGSDRAIVVTAHYDHVGVRRDEIYNGADDNASGVAGMLAIAEHFVENPPEHDVVFVAFDAEEVGLKGAEHFVANPPEALGEIAFNLNLDMIGYNEQNELYAVGSYHFPVLVPMIEEIGSSAPVTLSRGYDTPEDTGGDDWTLRTDSGPFFEAGIPFLLLSVEDHPHYHQPTDTFENLTRDFFLNAVETAILLAEKIDTELEAIAAAEPRVASDGASAAE